jgi:hypothetical protein
MTVALRHRLTTLAAAPGLSRRTIRMRLALIYGGLFLICGAGLLAITYVLVSNATAGYFSSKGPDGSTVSGYVGGAHGTKPPGEPSAGLQINGSRGVKLSLGQEQAGLDKREPFDLGSLAGHVLLTRQSDAHDRQLDIHQALAPAPAAGNPRLAERLIANLVDNALRHNLPGGYVEVVTGTKDSRAVLSVINTGPLVPAAALDRLLQPFQRLGPDRTGHNEGLGLGLSIVQAIAHAHEATLAIRPQPAGGLQVEVSFRQPAARHGSGPARGHVEVFSPGT